MLGDYCAECGRKGAGPRQLCRDCLPLYPIDDIAPAPGADHPPGHDECDCLSSWVATSAEMRRFSWQTPPKRPTETCGIQRDLVNIEGAAA